MKVIRKSKKGIISVLLVLALLISAVVCAGVVSAEENADGAESDFLLTETGIPTSDGAKDALAPTGASTVYCRNEAGWAEVYAYMWNSDSDKNADWPGVKMTDAGDGLLSYTADKSFANIIFNGGVGQAQTPDMEFPGSGQIFNNKTNSWIQGDPDAGQPDSGQPDSGQPDSGQPDSGQPDSGKPDSGKPSSSGSQYVYCENAAEWGAVYAYMWNGESDANAGWPGEKMTDIGNGIWQYQLAKSYQNVIFNGGSGQAQTPDMAFPGSGQIFNNKTNKWDVYDTSALQIQSFTTDLASPQFAGTGIVLSAKAEGEGTVRYKFSVTNGTNTRTITDYTAKTATIWTPTAPGDYTLTLDCKDSAGNTNQRTLSYKIEEGLKSASPFIKQVLPISGSQIKNADNCNVTVAAGGGITGTNLLFYKYTLKDANDKIINVPYYTRQTSFSFTPTALGQYTLTVSVQGSDNSTVERDYVYSSVTNVEEFIEPGDDTSTPSDPGGSSSDPGDNPSDPGSQPFDPQEPTTPAPTRPHDVRLKGDADGDNAVSILDATCIQRWLVGLVTDAGIRLDDADADSDGSVTILDATRIQRYLVGLETL